MWSWLTGHNKQQDYIKAGTEITRRGFLKYATAGVTGATLLALNFRQLLTGEEPGPGSADTLTHLKKSDFSRHLGEKFYIYKSELNKVDVQLIEVSSTPYDTSDHDEESFTLLFKGRHEQRLEQETYKIENDTMGTFPLFIVPVYSHDKDSRYEAVFNRSVV